ncbi:unnamed protein product [Phyllotreta striolata]|uniref:PPAF-2-like Clip domain-containing protein n=1 Tax=Phyllotreta striolata TaxID=444603 RepID=A0A9N9TMH0_PHYSR|nr:unnamed protein product [Phyllotreta striolata]
MLDFSKSILPFLLLGYCILTRHCCMTDFYKEYNDFVEGMYGCKCVPYYLCSAGNTIITSGNHLINPRETEPRRIHCKGYSKEMKVCCGSGGNNNPSTSVYKNPTDNITTKQHHINKLK